MNINEPPYLTKNEFDTLKKTILGYKTGYNKTIADVDFSTDFDIGQANYKRTLDNFLIVDGDYNDLVENTQPLDNDNTSYVMFDDTLTNWEAENAKIIEITGYIYFESFYLPLPNEETSYRLSNDSALFYVVDNQTSGYKSTYQKVYHIAPFATDEDHNGGALPTNNLQHWVKPFKYLKYPISAALRIENNPDTNFRLTMHTRTMVFTESNFILHFVSTPFNSLIQFVFIENADWSRIRSMFNLYSSSTSTTDSLTMDYNLIGYFYD